MMGSFLKAIDDHKPLAESRGFEIQPQNVDGVVNVLVSRVTPSARPRRHHGFATVTEAADFLRRQPELPRFRVKAHYTQGEDAVFEYHDADSPSALARAAKDAGQRSKPGYTLKCLEVL